MGCSWSSQATKDHTIVRKSTVTSGNTDWAASAGTSTDDSEWVVLPQNTWDYMGSHPHTFTYDCAGVVNGSATLDECGVCDGSGIAEGACDCDGTLPQENFDCAGNCLVGTDCCRHLWCL